MAVKIAGAVSGNLAEVTALGELKIAGTFSATTTTAYAGLTGVAVPTTAAFMGGEDPIGDLVGLKLTAGRALIVDGSAVTQPISVVSLPLPSGAATEATLLAVDSRLPPALGEQVMAASLPVVIASNQTAVPVAQSGIWNIGAVTTLGSIISTVAVGQATHTNLKGEVIGNKTHNNAAADSTFLQTLSAIATAADPTYTSSFVVALSTDLAGYMRTVAKVVPLTTSAVSSVTASAIAVTLAASNASRRQLAIYNNGSTILYLKLGSSASSTDFTIVMAVGGYFELPVVGGSVYTGVVTGIWTGSPTGEALVTEVTP